MKHKGFLLLILLAVAFIQAPALEAKSPYSFGEEFAVQWYLGTTDFGFTSDTSSFIFGLNFVSFSFMEQKTAIGIEFNPIQYRYIHDPKEHLFSFGQITLFWNALRLINYELNGIFGPFVRFDLFIHDTHKFDINRRIYTAGIQLAFDYSFLRVCGIELGYCNFDNKSNFYCSIKICPLAPPLLYLAFL